MYFLSTGTAASTSASSTLNLSVCRPRLSVTSPQRERFAPSQRDRSLRPASGGRRLRSDRPVASGLSARNSEDVTVRGAKPKPGDESERHVDEAGPEAQPVCLRHCLARLAYQNGRGKARFERAHLAAEGLRKASRLTARRARVRVAESSPVGSRVRRTWRFKGIELLPVRGEIAR